MAFLAFVGALIGFTTPTPTLDAAVRDAFTVAYGIEENGAILLTGNSQMTCPSAASGCAAARTASPSTSSSNAAINNNSFAMQFLDEDGLSTTTNSTSADVNMPAGSTVLFAQLVWGGRQTAGGNGVASSGAIGQVKFRQPGTTVYTTLTSTRTIAPSVLTGTDALPYQASVDVTSIVRAAGNGSYWVGDIRAATGEDRYAGWSLIVVYRNPSLPLRNLTVFEGFADVTTTSGNSSVSIPVSGFLTPATGAVNASVGFVAWEGDRGSIGDTLALGSTTLSDAARPANNFFDSAVSDAGVNVTARTPATANTFGVDIGRLTANGVLANGSTSTTVNVATNQEFFYPGVITTQIDLFTPSFNAVSKTVVNLSGNDPAKVGDTLEYRISYTNTGQDPADLSVVRDVIPPNTTFVPGSILVTQSPSNVNNGAKTDAAGDDIAEYLSGSRTVQARLGTGATATTGGTIAANAAVTFRFRVTLDRASAGSTVENTPTLSYRARTINRDYTFTGNTVATPVQDIAELALTKTSTPTAQTAGSAVQYGLLVTNNGPNAAAGVSVVDTLPSGVVYNGFTAPAGVSCSAAGQVVTCTVGAIANGAAVAITLNTSISAASAASTLVNSATVSATTADDVATNNTATAATQVSLSADLATTKTVVTPATATAGSTVTYSVAVANGGPSNASGVVMSDPIPAGATFVSATSTIGACAAPAGTVTCTIGALNAGQTATATIVIRLGTGYTATSLANTASASGSTADPNAANNTSTATQSVVRSSDVRITKTASSPSVNAGADVTYTIAAINDGPSDATGVIVTDPAVAGMTIQSVSTTRGTCTITAGSLSCTVGTLTPAATVVVNVVARVDATRAAGPLTNTASVSTTAPQSNTANDSANAAVTVTTAADLSIGKTGPAEIVGGSSGAYTLTVTNAGPSQAAGVSITDTLPTGISFVSSADGCTAAGQTVTCPVGALALGASATRTFQFSAGGAVSGTVQNTATVAATTADPSSANNTTTFSSSGANIADVQVTKSASPAAPVAGTDIAYTMVVTNAGPSTANGVSFSDPLPTGVSYTSSNVDGANICSVGGQTVTCALGTMTSGATRTVTIVGRVASDFTPGPLSNTASVTSTTPPDPSSSNNSATSTVQVGASADLGVVLAAGANPVVAGTTIGYTLTVTNGGPSVAQNTIVTGRVPDGLTPLVGSSGGVCVLVGQTVTCSLGALPSGASLVIPLSATVNPDFAPGPLVGRALIGSNTPDPQSANNNSVSTIQVIASADVQVTKTVDTNPLVAGAEATYTLRAINAGPSDAATVALTDTVAAGVTILAATSTIGACDVSGQTLTCTTPRLPAGATMAVTMRVGIASSATGTIANTASASSATSDPTPGSNSASTSTPVVENATLTVIKTGSPQPVRAGTAETYQITVTNAGPSDAAAVTLEDVLPTGFTVLPTGLTSSGDACTANTARTAVNCAFGGVPAGQARTVVIEALVPAGTAAGTVLTNTAVADSPTSTQAAGARSASAVTNVVTEADLAVVIATVDSPDAGAPSNYTVSVSNLGPSTALGAVAVVPLPVGTTFVAASTSVGSCSLVGNEIVCPIGDLTRGNIATIQVTFDLAANLGGTTLVTTASVSSQPSSGAPTADPVMSNNTSSVTETVGRRADITITKTITSGPIVAGANVVYSISATNTGPSDTTELLIEDTLPAGVNVVSATANNGGACQVVSGVLTCRWATVALGATRTATLTVAVPAGATTGVSLANTATARSNAIDPTPTSATATGTITASANLIATKTLLSGTPVAGGVVRWQVAVRNDGPSTASTVSIVDNAPSGVTFTNASTTNGACTVAASQISCALGDLTVGVTATVTLVGQLDQGFTSPSLTNTATITSATSDPDPSDNSPSITTSTSASADLSIVKTANSSSFVAGQGAAWTITVTNNGPSAAQAVVVTDAVPAGLSDIAATIVGGSACSVTATDVTCAIGAIAASATRSVTLTATVSPGFSAASVVNTATVSSSTADPDPSNAQGQATTPVSTSADVRIDKAGPANAAPGATVAWTITVVNDGPSVARGVSIADQLPTTLLNPVVSFPGAVCPIAAGVARCELGIVPVSDGTPATSVVITVEGRIDPSATGSVTNTATATASTTDGDPSNNGDSVTTSLSAAADVRITNEADSASFVPGTSIGWTLTAVNDGPSLARDIVITDAVPAAVSSIAASILTPSGPVTCTVTGQNVSCPIGDLAPGAVARVHVTGNLAASAATATIVNSAAVSSTTTDGDLANNSADATTPLAPSANLAIGKDVVDAVAGDSIQYAVTATNLGPSTARDVVVSDALPADIAPGSVIIDNPDCARVGSLITCALGELAVGVSVTIGITGDLALGADTVVNTASISASTNDPDPTNDSSTATAIADELADIAIDVDAPASVIAGDLLQWTIVVTNNGPSNALDVNVSETLPTGLVDLVVSTEPDELDVDCTAASPVVCTVATMAPGATRTITLTARVPASSSASSVTNSAAATSTTPDPTGSNNADSASTTITREALLQVAKSVDPTTLTPGLPATFTITVFNAGPSDAAGTLAQDALPAGLVLDGSATATQGSCSSVGDALSCALGVISAGSTVTVTIPVTVDPATPASTITNTATASSSTPAPVGAPAPSGFVNASVTPRADLTLTNTAPATVTAGSPIVWEMTLRNDGPSVAGNVVITNTLPAGTGPVTLVSSQGSCSRAGDVVTCVIGALSPGATSSVIIDLNGDVSPSQPAGVLTSIATVTSSATEPDPTLPDGRRADANTTVVTSADLYTAISANDSVATPGAPISWTAIVGNNGPSTAFGVVVTDVAPAGVSAVTMTAPGMTCTPSPLRCTIAQLLPGQTVQLTINGVLAASSTASSLVNLINATTTTPDPNLGNNEASASLLVAASADISIAKVATGPVVRGASVGWTLTVTSTGPSVARDVVVNDIIPAGVSNVAVTVEPSGAATCDETVSCAIGDLAPGQTIEIEIVGTLDAAFGPGALGNTATVASSTADPDGASNTASTSSAVSSVADLAVTKTGPATAIAGQSITWTITVANSGPSAATSVTVADPLPADVLGATATPSQGACSGAITCSLGTIGSGGQATVTITGQIDPLAAPGVLANTATATSAATDPAGGNNSATASTTVSSAADVAIVKSVAPDPLTPGSPATFTLDVSSSGPSTATGVSVTDVVPTGLIIGVVSAPDGDCDVTGQTITCALDDLAAGATTQIEIPVDVPAGFGVTTYSNTASVLAATPDPDAGNNVSAVSGVAAPRADLALTATGAPGVVATGDTVTLALTIDNAGPAAATDVVLTDTLPAGIDVSSVVPSAGGICDPVSGTTLVCRWATIPPGGSATVTITGVATATSGSLTNSAAVTAASFDPDVTNNAGNASVVIAATSDVGVTKVVTSGGVLGGGDVAWRITVTNNDAAPALGAQVVDILPAEVSDVAASASAGSCTVTPGAGGVGGSLQGRARRHHRWRIRDDRRRGEHLARGARRADEHRNGDDDVDRHRHGRQHRDRHVDRRRRGVAVGAEDRQRRVGDRG